MARISRKAARERQAYMKQIFLDFYKENGTGKDLSVQKAQDLYKKKYNAMMANRRAYEIRSQVLSELGGAQTAHQIVRAVGRRPQGAAAKARALLIEGTPEQLEAIRTLVSGW